MNLDDRNGVAVGIEGDRFSAGVPFGLYRPESDVSRGQRGRGLFYVGHGEGNDAVPSMNEVANDIEPTSLGYLPHHFGLVRNDIGGAIEETLVPSPRRVEVADRDAHEEDIDVHGAG